MRRHLVLQLLAESGSTLGGRSPQGLLLRMQRDRLGRRPGISAAHKLGALRRSLNFL